MRYAKAILRRIFNFSTPLLGFTSLMQNMRGAHPSVVRTVLEQGHVDLLNALLTREYQELDQGPNGRQDNPILASWYYAASSVDRFFELRNWKDVSVGLFGTPSLVGKIISHGPKRVALFDYDPIFEDTDSHPTHKSIETVRCDLRAADLSHFRQTFDIVVMDPPWYPSDMLSWLEQAVSLVKPGGTICGSLYPELLRPSALRERSSFLQLLSSFSEKVSVQPDFFLYLVPSFEKAQLRELGLPTQPWKRADLFAAQIRMDFDASSFTWPSKLAADKGIRFKPDEWIKIILPGITFFVNPRRPAPTVNALLQSAHGENAILPSPSHRDPALRSANVLTSQGHAFLSAMPMRLIQILSTIEKPSDLQRYMDDVDKESILRLSNILATAR